MLKFDYGMALTGTSRDAIESYGAKAVAANDMLINGSGCGADFLGWTSLPSDISDDLLAAIRQSADRLRTLAEVVVVIGIGGSYLGARAVLEALKSPLKMLKKTHDGPHILFAGHNLSETYMNELLEVLAERSFGAIVISKSGTTTEPAVAFRIIRRELERRYGKSGARGRIVAITDANRGALRQIATTEGYDTFSIPDNVGGRYSVLTPVGLVPLAMAGIDVGALVAGARAMQPVASARNFTDNPAIQYAAVRNALYNNGFKVEVLGSYEPSLQYVGEWWKQLFGESEGKQGHGIFPASVTFTTDLHSLGQYIQDGERMLFETIVSVEAAAGSVAIESEPDDIDGMNFLAGRRLNDINHIARKATALAHLDGGVPNLCVTVDRIDEFCMGELLYFFERACGISGYVLGVNPFDQPGVEAYKKNMFALLGKPGYELQQQQLLERLATK